MNHFESLIQPDLFHWEQLQSSLQQQGIEDAGFIDSLKKLALGSNYAITQLAKYPSILNQLRYFDYFDLEQKRLAQTLDETDDINQVKKELRLYRHQKLVEIIYMDICQQADVEHTLLRLSELADVLIQQSLNKAEQILSGKHGQPVDENGNPMQLNIIGMGKLGGKELNFSSDIDLICCYSEDGQLKGFGQQSYKQYFTNVVKLFKQFLHESTVDGFVYRVDLRLRPWGDSGPIVLSHSGFEHYYQLHGREWEQYAMVKARVITGNEKDKQHLQSILTPFVYRRYHDYRVFDGLASLKHKIDQQAKNKSPRYNVKIGRGGIREIEFYVQAFQILKGGRNHKLQTPSLYQAINVLSAFELTEQHELEQMRDSYCFLRMLENRIQMMNDQQTHQIPDKQNLLDRISLLMDYDDWNALEQDLIKHRNRVNKLFSTLFVQENKTPAEKKVDISPDELDEQAHRDWIQTMNFIQGEDIHQQLQDFYQSKALLFMSDKAKKRFRSFFPELLKQVAAHPQQQALLSKLLSLLSSIAGRSVYFELLYQHPALLTRLVDLFESSDWIASEVTSHPILLESLLYPEPLDQRFDKNYQNNSLTVQLRNIAGDEEMELDILRQFKRAHTITIASAQIAEEITSDEVSLYLSELAEIILQAVYKLSLQTLVGQYGEPSYEIEGQQKTAAMGIIAYGKLGGYELHYQSDLDIIFVHNSIGSKQQTRGEKSIDNATFFSRLAQKMISKITLLTAAGKLYEIDTRLRPDGASGLLVSSMKSYQHYQHNKAWVWEHQALIRARYIAGNADIKADFDKVRKDIITLPREDAVLKTEIDDMRNKMYQAKNPPEGEYINIKHSHGCMVDIEFLVQYWVLKHANKFASLCETTDNNGLITELHRLGLIDDEDLRLRDIYQTLHKCLHAQVLQNQPDEIPSQRIQQEIETVQACWKKYL